MAKREPLWVAKMDMTLGGRKVNRGQIVKPGGDRNDHRIFADSSRWTYRFDGGQTEVCGTDGCQAEFSNLGVLDRHRLLVHKPEHDRREIERAKARQEAEEAGETFAGQEVVKVQQGPGGPVPYIKHPAVA